MMNYQLANIQTIAAEWLVYQNVFLDVLRLDKIHTVVSGNKWFKLKYYLEEAKKNNQEVVTFGGAWSNHIVAVAFCCQKAGLKCTGIIRGEKPEKLSKTLLFAMEYDMNLQFVSREDYGVMKSKQKKAYSEQRTMNSEKGTMNNAVQKSGNEQRAQYFIPEGGYGALGVKGAAEISMHYDLSSYTHIVAGVGTGTMLAGLIRSSKPHQKIIGISSMKGNNNLEEEVKQLLKTDTDIPKFQIIHDYHFGGFGKHLQVLIDFINEIFENHELPLDFVYTGKTFYAIKDLVEKNFFPKGSKILMIHSGGLQGNKSIEVKLKF